MHFLTYSCYRRLPLLTRARTQRGALESLAACRRLLDVARRAYVIMPEPVHAPLFPCSADATMRRVPPAVKLPVTVAARRRLEATAWLRRLKMEGPTRAVFRRWQPGGGYGANIFRERTVREVMDYIHANPVRRGLVATREEWEWSSARF